MTAKSGSLVVAVAIAAVVLAFVTMTEYRRSPWNRKAEPMDSQSDKGLHTNETIRQVWDSRLYPYGDTLNTVIYWLDDSTLLFMADKNPKPATPEDAPKRTPWLYLWRLGEKPRPIGEDPQEATRFYRAARGIVCYQQKKIDPETGKTSILLMKGPPGQEREAPPWKRLTVENDGVTSNGVGFVEDIDCEQFADRAMAGRIYATDTYRRYYVDRAPYPPGLPPAVGENPILMKSDGSDRKVLPIPPEEFGGVHFHTFEDVIWSLESPLGSALRGGSVIDGFVKWKNTNCLALWRIDPASSSTERGCIPFGPWSGQAIDPSHGSSASITLVPTAKGLFFASTKYTDSNNPEHVGASGFYKLENGAVRRVLAGYLVNASVSPDGCRVAFVYGPNWATTRFGTPGSWTIAAIDLCK